MQLIRNRRFVPKTAHSLPTISCFLAIAYFTWATIGLSGLDGGSRLALHSLFLLFIFNSVVLLTLVPRTPKLPRTVTLPTLLYGLGLILSFTFAHDRTDFIFPSMTALAVVSSFSLGALVALYPFSPKLLVFVIIANAVTYEFRGAEIWWGSVSSGSPPGLFLVVSWHNQSGILFGALGVGLLGIVFFGPKNGAAIVVKTVSAALAVVAFAFLWQTRSRGAIAATAVGLFVVLLLSWLLSWSKAVRIMATATLLLISALLLAGLMRSVEQSPPSSMPGASSAFVAPLARAQAPFTSFSLRTKHWRSAVRMFIARPLVGHGPGSFKRTAPRYSEPNWPLTSSAHNEYLQTFAESGLIAGLGLFGIPVAVVFGTWRLMRRTRQVARTHAKARWWQVSNNWSFSSLVTASSMASALAIHAAIDFDFSYIAIGTMTGFLAGFVAVGSRSFFRPANRFSYAAVHRFSLQPLGVILIVIALLFDISAYAFASEVRLFGKTFFQTRPTTIPWDAVYMGNRALCLAKTGQTERAKNTIDKAIAWNPGDPDLKTDKGLVELVSAGSSPDKVIETLIPGKSGIEKYNQVANVFIELGFYDAAERVLDVAEDFYSKYNAWPVGPARRRSAELRQKLAITRAPNGEMTLNHTNNYGADDKRCQ